MMLLGMSVAYLILLTAKELSTYFGMSQTVLKAQ
jgi:hypothetical protein